MKKTILITGSNSGIGRMIAEIFSIQGWNVAATMRDLNKAGDLLNLPNVKIFQLDVTDLRSIKESKDEIIKTFGKVDVLINNAGFGVYGAFELAAEAEIDRQFAVNVKGLMMVTKAWLPHLRETRGGTIVNISSVAGINSYPLASLYVSSKWAVEGFTESLYYEVKPFNIRLKLIEPGGFRTNFQTSSIVWTENQNVDVYNNKIKKLRDYRNARQDSLPDPKEVALIAYKAANDNTDQLRFLIGKDAHQMMASRNEMGAENYIQKVFNDYNN